MKVGVVGLGFMGSTHLQAYSRIEGAEVAAVVSSDERKLAGDLSQVGGNLSIPGQKMDFGSASRYRTPQALFEDPSVEAVDLCVPTDLHQPLAEQALEAGKHVLVEKPMALSLQQCHRMIDASKRNGKVLMVAQVLRFWPDYATARLWVLGGRLGPIRTASLRRRCAAPAWGGWLQDPHKSGGGAFDLLIHDFDFCVHLWGRPARVAAAGVEDLERGIDLLETRLDFPGGQSAVVSGGWHPPGYPFSMEFTLTGEEGALDFHSDLRRLTFYPRQGEAAEIALPDTDGFQAELEVFVAACEAGVPPAQCPPEESALAVEVTLAAVESRQTGQTIAL